MEIVNTGYATTEGVAIGITVSNLWIGVVMRKVEPMRLIDLDDHIYCGMDGEYERWNIDPLVQSIDAVEVVRCKDCRYYEIMQLKRDGTDDRRYKPSLCVLHNRNFDEDYFCADGERREDDSD